MKAESWGHQALHEKLRILFLQSEGSVGGSGGER